jgi:hypothetical protein
MGERPLPPIPHKSMDEPTPGPSSSKKGKLSKGSEKGSMSSNYESLENYQHKHGKGKASKVHHPRVKQWNTISSMQQAYTGLSHQMLQEARQSLHPVKIPPWEKQLRKGYMGKGFKGEEEDVHPVTKAHVPHSFDQQSTPFLSLRRHQSESDQEMPASPHRNPPLKGRKVNSLQSWKSITTLDTQHTGDGEEVYNQLQNIANTFGE